MSSIPNPATVAHTITTEKKETPLLDAIVEKGGLGPEKPQNERARNLIEEFLRLAVQGHLAISHDAESTITAHIRKIDELISSQINEILHDQKFQQLEATWRGVEYLIQHSETNASLKIKLFNATKPELLKNFKNSGEFDQSALFKKVYSEEYDTLGGQPYAALVGDYEFDRGPEDMDLIGRIAQVAASAHAPFISAASPDLINQKSFTGIPSIRDMSMVYDDTTFAKWKSFRDSEDARYVALALPRILMREPWGEGGRKLEAFNYQEGVDGKDHSKYLWGNAAYALAARLTNSFARYGWCAAIRGVKDGGRVEDLPVHNFTTDKGNVVMKCPTEVSITERRGKELSDSGFVPLEHCRNTDYAAFLAVQSVNKPKKYDKPEAEANSRLSSQLPYTLAMSRFAHFLKAMMRERIGSSMNRVEAQLLLNQWIAQYTLMDDNASAEAKAEKPLRESKIEVVEVPGNAGKLRAVAYLKPHFQLDEISVSLRLVADSPQSKK